MNNNKEEYAVVEWYGMRNVRERVEISYIASLSCSSAKKDLALGRVFTRGSSG